MHNNKIGTLLLASLVLAGCANKAPAPAATLKAPKERTVDVRLPAPAIQDALDQRRDTILSRTDEMKKVAGELTDDNGTVSYVAYFDDGELRYLKERIESGDKGYGEHFYFVDNGKLFGYQEDANWTLSPPDGKSADDETDLDLYLDQYGTIAYQRYVKNGQRTPLPVAKIDNIKTRFSLLADRVERQFRGEKLAPIALAKAKPQPKPKPTEPAPAPVAPVERTTVRATTSNAWEMPEYVGVSKSLHKGMNMGTFQVATSNVNMQVMPGVKAKDYHLGQMVALTQYWCAYRPDNFEMQWNYWSASRQKFQGQYVFSCGQARSIMKDIGEGQRTVIPVHVRLKGVQDAAIKLLALDTPEKKSTLRSLEKRFATPCLEHFCAGQSYLDKR